MATHHVPKGVSVETLREILAGWAAVGAVDDPAYTSDVADETGIADAVGRQTRFLEDVGVLEADGQRHRLTDCGAALADALDAGDEDAARRAASDLLTDWPLTDAVRGVVRDNPTPPDDLAPVVAALAGQDLDDDRVRTGVGTLLEFFAWAGVLDCEDGKYRLPGDSDAEGSNGRAAGPAFGDGGASTPATGGDAAAALRAALDGVAVGADGKRDDDHALSLRVDVDANPDDLEAVVRAIRRGLTASNDGASADGDGA